MLDFSCLLLDSYPTCIPVQLGKATLSRLQRTWKAISLFSTPAACVQALFQVGHTTSGLNKSDDICIWRLHDDHQLDKRWPLVQTSLLCPSYGGQNWFVFKVKFRMNKVILQQDGRVQLVSNLVSLLFTVPMPLALLTLVSASKDYENNVWNLIS